LNVGVDVITLTGVNQAALTAQDFVFL